MWCILDELGQCNVQKDLLKTEIALYHKEEENSLYNASIQLTDHPSVSETDCRFMRPWLGSEWNALVICQGQESSRSHCDGDDDDGDDDGGGGDDGGDDDDDDDGSDEDDA